MLRSLVSRLGSLGAVAGGATFLGALLGKDLGAFSVALFAAFSDAISGVFLEGGLETAYSAS